MLINELAKRTGVTVHTLRFYEAKGLIAGQSTPEVRSNNYKNYSEQTVKTVLSIKHLKSVGFTLAEIKEVIDAYFSGTATLATRHAVLSRKVTEIEHKIKELKTAHSRLQEMLAEVEKGVECRD